MNIQLDTLAVDEITLVDQNGEKQTHNLSEVLLINEHNLPEEIKKQPSLYVYWSSVSERVRAYHDSASLKVEQLHAQLYEQARSTLIQDGTAKPTVAQVESWIMNQDAMVEAKEQELLYQGYVKQLHYVVKSLEQRHGMLVQLSALQRDQLEYERAINNL